MWGLENKKLNGRMGPNVYLTQKYIQKRMIGASAGMAGNEKHGDIFVCAVE